MVSYFADSPVLTALNATGYSASVFDMKLYVTYNPFNVSLQTDRQAL